MGLREEREYLQPNTHIQLEELFPIILGEGRGVCLFGCKNPSFQHPWAATFLSDWAATGLQSLPFDYEVQNQIPCWQYLFRAPPPPLVFGKVCLWEESLLEITSPLHPKRQKIYGEIKPVTAAEWDSRPCPASNGEYRIESVFQHLYSFMCPWL